VQRKVKCVSKESNMRGIRCGSRKLLVENVDKTNLSLPFVKHFGLTSGASVRDKGRPNHDEKGFQLFLLL